MQGNNSILRRIQVTQLTLNVNHVFRSKWNKEKGNPGKLTKPKLWLKDANDHLHLMSTVSYEYLKSKTKILKDETT